MGGANIFVAAAVSAGCGLSPARDVSLADHDIRIHDVVTGDCPAAAAPSVRDAVIAHIPSAETSVRLTHRALANLIRRRVPDLPINLTSPADDGLSQVTLHVAARREPVRETQPCYAAAAAIAAGEIISSAALARTQCVADERPIVVYDRTYGLTRAGVDIAAGAYLGRVDVPPARTPDTGDALALVAIVGAATVERPVIAAQPGANRSQHGAIFVRDADGHVFAAPLAPVSAHAP